MSSSDQTATAHLSTQNVRTVHGSPDTVGGTTSYKRLTELAGLSAVVGGLLYLAVQINHPQVDLALATTAEWKIRESMKVLFAALSLAGITGMYLQQVKLMKVLGFIGYLLSAIGFLILMSVEVIGAVVLPTIAATSPGYVADVLAAANNGASLGDIGLMQTVNLAAAAGYVGGGLIFGIASFRANILARWASMLLSIGAIATLAIPLLPQVNQRLFAIPTGVALVGLGYSLWRTQRTSARRPVTTSTDLRLDPALSP